MYYMIPSLFWGYGGLRKFLKVEQLRIFEVGFKQFSGIQVVHARWSGWLQLNVNYAIKGSSQLARARAMKRQIFNFCQTFKTIQQDICIEQGIYQSMI